MSASVNLTALSDEVILHVLSFVRPKELIRLRLTCRRLRYLVGDQRIWENVLAGEYGLPRELFWPDWSPEEMYEAIHTFRELLGYWLCELEHFGMLVDVKIEQSGIMAYECLPPADDSILDLEAVKSSFKVAADVDYANVQRLHQFRLRRLFGFAASTGQNGSPRHRFLRFVCYHSSHGVHSAAHHSDQTRREEGPDVPLSLVAEDTSACFRRTENGFIVACVNKPEHQPLDVRYWFELEHGLCIIPQANVSLNNVLSGLRDEKDYDLRLEKYDAKSELNCFCLSRCIPYSLPDFGPPVRIPGAENGNFVGTTVIDTGFYFGHFNWHGWEILKVSYTDNGRTIIGEKITGDQMIPVGKTSFRVDLRRRVHLNAEDQATMAALRTAAKMAPVAGADEDAQDHLAAGSTRYGAVENGDTLPAQTAWHPFRLPADCAVLGTSTLPEYCLCCFAAEGQIAFPNYYNPRYLSCICVVFSRTNIGLLWLDLKCFMPMYKVLSPCCG